MAPDLIGRAVCRRDGALSALKIVETEAYLGAEDPACHARGGMRTRRNEAIWLAGGHAYLFLVYGVHWCLNAVTGDGTDGDAVLLRAGEPLAGTGPMRRRRGLSGHDGRPLAAGPGMLTQSLGVDGRWDGKAWREGDLWIAAGTPAETGRVVAGPRVGVEYSGEAAAWPLRFTLRKADGPPPRPAPTVT